MNVQNIFIAGLIAAFVITGACDGMVHRAAALLDRDTRERVWQREARAVMWWRILEYLGIGLMVLGVLRLFKILLFFGYPYSAMAAGVVLFCAARSLHACFTCRAYGAEAPGSPAARSSRNAAILVTLTECAFAGVVAWFVIVPNVRQFLGKPGGAQAAAPAAQAPAKSPATKTPASASADPFWVDEAEALRMLKGKDAAYLSALARRKDIRDRETNGRREYRRDDIIKMKEAGLPSIEELKEE